ncbi:MAG: alkaline phosphatase D family protein [Candidatus Melainabacteria bacterium]|nr:alkaline phosphatase D family protein [Candidatus Melainabacteria bacterium]
MISRRRFLKSTASLLLGSQFLPAFATGPSLKSFKSDPFKLGVASGSPRPESVVLWTRLAPDPLKGGGLNPEPIKVKWEVARDESFHKIVKKGEATAAPQYAHSVHAEVQGLEPGKEYWYRFFAGDAKSPVGRTKTAPAKDSHNPFRFTFASCQMYEQGYYTAHRHIAQEDLDLVVFLGDYIYEHSWGHNDVRKHEGPEVYTLDQYRNRYACYKSDADLQLCHARFPWIVTWDDHEVDNDYANDLAEDLKANFLLRRAAAYQAFYEHMPLPPSFAPHNADMKIYQAFDFGQMARFHVLDDRQYRDHEVCPKPGRAGSNYINDCAERKDPKRTILGWEQEKWLSKSLKDSHATWDVIAQQTLMAQSKRNGGKFWTDGWDGYPASRRRLLEAVSNRPVADTLVIGGDIHSYAVADLKLDFDKPNSKTVATEVCGTSISSEGPPPEDVNAFLKNNPHIKFASRDYRGYVRVTLNKNKADVSLRAIESEKIANSKIKDLANFTVQKGRPGAEKA